MPPWLPVALRWTVALALTALAITQLGPMAVDAFQSSVELAETGEELPEVAPAAGPPPVQGGRSQALAQAGSEVRTVESVEGAAVTLGDGLDQLLLGFEPVPADPSCIAGVTLEVYTRNAPGTEVHAVPLRIDDLAGLSTGDALPADHVLDASSPGTADADESGWLRFNVTGPYALAHRRAAGETVVFGLLPAEDDEVGPQVATLEDGEGRAPRLRWAVIEGCAAIDGDERDEDGG